MHKFLWGNTYNFEYMNSFWTTSVYGMFARKHFVFEFHASKASNSVGYSEGQGLREIAVVFTFVTPQKTNGWILCRFHAVYKY